MTSVLTHYLKANNYSNYIEEFENFFLSHPNYPSIYAITDSFDALAIESICVRITKDQFSELPSKFLAIYKNEIVYVKKDIRSIQIIDSKASKTKLSFESFLNDWNGIIIAIEENEKDSNTSFLEDNYSVIFFSVFVVIMSILYYQKSIGFQFLNIGLYLIGFIVSLLIINEKLSNSKGTLSKICSFNNKTDCESVIKSNSSYFFKWLDFSDLPILYYSFSILAISIDFNSLKILNALSFLSLPIVLYSIWLQKKKIRKWCVLCLFISFLLISQTAFFIYDNSYTVPTQSLLVPLLLSLILSAPLWFYIKPIIFFNKNLKNDNYELIKFKRNFELFEHFLKPVVSESKLDSFSKIELGNLNSSITLTLIISPSCGHCHTVFNDAIQLLNRHPNKIKLNIFYNINLQNKKNEFLSIAVSSMQINKINPRSILEALSDWHIKRMPLVEWYKKWKLEAIDQEILIDLERQFEWCLENELNFTPVKMINSKILPDEYQLNDVKYFLNDIEEKLNPEWI